MKALDLLQRLRQAGVRLWVQDGNLRLNAPKGTMTPGLEREIKEAKPELLDLLQEQAGQAITPLLESVPREGPLPLSSFQERLWVLHRLDPTSGAYTLSAWQEYPAPLDEGAARASLNQLVQRHEILRTNFVAPSGNPELRINPPGSVGLTFLDWSEEDEDDWEPKLRALATEVAHIPMDLSEGPLLRPVLIRTSASSFALLLTVHHIVTDAWSLGLMLAEWAGIYGALAEHGEISLPPPSLQYADYSAWQRTMLNGPVAKEQESFWEDYLAGAPTVLTLPSDRPRGATQDFTGDIHLFSLSPDLGNKVREVCQTEGVTPFMVWLATFGLLLGRYTSRQDILIGSPIASRTSPALETMLGPFVNTLVLRHSMEDSDTGRTLFKRVRESVLAAHGHQTVPFERLVEIIQVERTMAHPPLFQVACAYHNQPGRSDFHVTTGGSMFELTLNGFEIGDQLAGSFEYNTALFNPDTIQRMGTHFQMLLHQMVEDLDAPLATLPLMTEEESTFVVQTWNDTSTKGSWPVSVVDEFQKWVKETPEAVAVTFGAESLSYQALDARATELARRLNAHGCGRGDPVAILLPRGPDLVAATIAAMKAGAVYIPLDPEYPAARIQYILGDAGAKAAFTTGDVSEGMNGLGVPEIDITENRGDTNAGEDAGSHPSGGVLTEPDDLAYVIYTSGTTGKPKGVEVTHGGLANVLASLAEEPGFSPSDSMLAVTTFAFDIAGVELLLPLTRGGTVVVASSRVAEHGKRLLALMDEVKPTVMQATPATWQMLLDAGWEVEADREPQGLRVWCGGEALPRSLADGLLDRAEEVWNLYGPTETTIWSARWKVERETGSVPIGTPISNTTVYVLDSHGNPVPIGVPGELFIGGAGVARGYRNLPDQTAASFRSRTTEEGETARVYRTGDLARWTSRGNLECLGRIDSQVKVRGHRIELGEIESVLLEHESIRAAAASVWENRIVVYLVFDEGHEETASDVRRFLRRKLPEYMIPGFVVPLPELPMTENRKIDRKSLPSPQAGNGALRSRAFEPPRGENELAVASIWQDLLGDETKVGAHDNFFELGGHSLLALQAVYQMEQLKGRPLDPRAIFFETLRQLAAR